MTRPCSATPRRPVARRRPAAALARALVARAWLAPDLAAADTLRIAVAHGIGGSRCPHRLLEDEADLAPGAAQCAPELHPRSVGVDPRRVTMVPLHPEETVAAPCDGRVDAVAVREPNVPTLVRPGPRRAVEPSAVGIGG